MVPVDRLLFSHPPTEYLKNAPVHCPPTGNALVVSIVGPLVQLHTQIRALQPRFHFCGVITCTTYLFHRPIVLCATNYPSVQSQHAAQPSSTTIWWLALIILTVEVWGRQNARTPVSPRPRLEPCRERVTLSFATRDIGIVAAFYLWCWRDVDVLESPICTTVPKLQRGSCSLAIPNWWMRVRKLISLL